MEASDLLSLLEQLDDNVDDLEESLQPLLNRPLIGTSKKLPVLDKAKLYVLTTYALESLLFSYLRLHGVNAKEHPVFRELTRVKQYFEKIKGLENGPEERNITLDKQAAGRFIKHSLAGNERIDLERKEHEAKSKARTQLKAAMLAKKSANEKSSSQGTDRSDDSSDSDGEGKIDVEPAPAADPLKQPQPQQSKKKQKLEARREAKGAKRHKKPNKHERQELKKERRERKLEKRKAGKAKETE